MGHAVAGCLTGTVFLAILAHVARTSGALDQGNVRLAFLPAVAALAFVPRRPVPAADPDHAVPAWVAPACHLLLAAPVLALTCWAQLRIMAYTIPPHALGHAPPSTR